MSEDFERKICLGDLTELHCNKPESSYPVFKKGEG